MSVTQKVLVLERGVARRWIGVCSMTSAGYRVARKMHFVNVESHSSGHLVNAWHVLS